MAIDQSLLKKYTNAYVMYEIASHGVDPRESLDGTIMKRAHDEGYKIAVYEENHQKLIKGGPYSDIIIDALPG